MNRQSFDRFWIFNDGEKFYDDKSKWVRDIFNLAEYPNTLFITYKKSWQDFEFSWQSPQDSDKQNFLNTVCKGINDPKVENFEIVVTNCNNQVFAIAWVSGMMA